MAGYKTKLRQWQDAGLITAPQADAIFAWEQDRKAGKFGRGLFGIGVFAILLGVLSIIAANWYAIPAAVKIGAHFILNAAVAAAAWRGAAHNKEMLREGATLAFFALTATLMILIGQVFQLDGTLTGLTATWMVITLPFMWFFGQTRLTAVPWMLAFLTSVVVAMTENLDSLPHYWQIFFVAAVATLLPLGLIADGSLNVFRRLKPAYADVFVRAGLALFAIGATLASFVWLSSRHMEISTAAAEIFDMPVKGYLYLAAIPAVALAGIALRTAWGQYFAEGPAHRAGLLFCVASVLMITAPLFFPFDNSSFASAVLFILYWIFVGWIGQKIAWSRLISLAIVLVVIRIFAIYVEVFRDMLSTGIGLIISGAVLIALISLARRMNKRFAGKGALHG